MISPKLLVVASICFTVIVVASIAALTVIAVTHDGSITPQVVSALGSVVTAFTIVLGYVGKDVVAALAPMSDPTKSQSGSNTNAN